LVKKERERNKERQNNESSKCIWVLKSRRDSTGSIGKSLCNSQLKNAPLKWWTLPRYARKPNEARMSESNKTALRTNSK